MENWLTISEFAEHARYSITQIRRLVKQGSIPSTQPAGKGGKILIPQDALHNLVHCNSSVATHAEQQKQKKLSGRKPGWKT